MNDLRYALRSLRNSPGFTATAVLILALGIGANASVFGIVDTLLFRPPAHVRDPGTVKRVYFRETGPSGDRTTPIMSFPVYQDFVEHARSITHLAAMSVREVSVAAGPGEARPAEGLLVTHTYFPLLGVAPAMGRFFGPEEDQPGVEPVVVLSHAFWRREFASEPSAVGTPLRIGADLYTVIGVAPEGFMGIDLQTVDLWLPMRRANAAALANRNSSWLRMITRLPPGQSAEVAALELTQVFRGVSRGAPAFGFDSTATVVLGPLHHARGPTPSQEAKVSVWLGAVAVLLLLIVCANVANLLLAHATSRRHDIAVRIALGAGRSRVLRQVLVQTLVLALAGGVAALLVAVWTTPVLQALLLRDVPAAGGGLDLRVLVFTVAVALLAGAIAGIVPAVQASRPNVVATLKSETRGESPRARTRTALVVVQVALTLVLLAGAGLFIRSVRNIRGDLGFTADKVIVGTMDDLRRSGRPRAAIDDLYLRMVERLGRLPGVERVAAAIG
ncbi:MAG: ABC transporter permease, partial [Gemmatimonadetes bacterium]|nr:ABC transporter permease [Gemmatimonadota bacterium]